MKVNFDCFSKSSLISPPLVLVGGGSAVCTLPLSIECCSLSTGISYLANRPPAADRLFFLDRTRCTLTNCSPQLARLAHARAIPPGPARVEAGCCLLHCITRRRHRTTVPQK